MQFLKTNDLGGFPFRTDDIRWAEKGFNDQAAAILKAYKPKVQHTLYGTPPPNSFIIHGCELGGNAGIGITWTDGAVMIDGVIYSVPAGSTAPFNILTEAPYFIRSVTFDPAGLKQFQNIILPIDTYGNRVAIPTIMPHGQTELVYTIDTSRFLFGIEPGDRLPIMVGSGSDAPPYSANWTYYAPTPLKFRKNVVGDVQLAGAIQRVSSVSSPNIFRLPVGYRPEQNLWFTVPNNFTYNHHMIEVAPDGWVTEVGGTGTLSGDLLGLSSVGFTAYQ